MTQPNAEPLPCPFCGSPSWLEPTSSSNWKVVCHRAQPGIENFCLAVGPYRMEKADAIAAWNRRAPSAEAVTMPPYHEGHECCPKCVAEKAVLVSALNGMQEFHDCMEAQRKDEPLPEGHDDPDEACGDGVCYRVGDIIKRGIEVAREVTTAPAKAEVVAARERVCEAAKRFAPTWLTGDQIRNAPAHLKNTALADLLDALAALERARKEK